MKNWKKEGSILMNEKKKNPCEIVLKALLSGATFHHGGWEVAMGEDYSVGYVMTNHTTGEKTISGDMTVRHFIKMCEDLNEEELISLSFSSLTRGELSDIMRGVKK